MHRHILEGGGQPTAQYDGPRRPPWPIRPLLGVVVRRARRLVVAI